MQTNRFNFFTPLIIPIVFPLLLWGDGYETYLKKQQHAFITYQSNINQGFQNYQQAYQLAYQNYVKAIENHWPTIEVSSATKWVEYDRAFATKKVVDFKNSKVTLALSDKTTDHNQSKQKLLELFTTLLDTNVSDAHQRDLIEQDVAKHLKKRKTVVNNDQPIIADVFNEEMIKQVKEQISKEPLQTKQENGKEVTFITFKLPKGTHLKKAAKYHPLVNTYAKRQRIPNALVFAIIHAESYFNPLARSHIPAFGLMQIVPNSAGVDAYEYLYGKKRLLNADYLYDGKRNITIGTAYIHLLYYRYLKGITNKYSRLYCTMAAYNTGPGNIARTFTNTRNIKQAVNVINRLTPQEVYEKLKNELPYEETRNYIVKVNRLMHQYAGFKPQGENN